MTNRLKIDQSGLFVSRPGFDVLTASDAHMLFNSKMVNTRVLQRGTASVTNEQQVYFGVTYPIIPFFLFYTYLNGYYMHAIAGGTARELFDPGRPFATVQKDRFWINHYDRSTLNIHYILMER